MKETMHLVQPLRMQQVYSIESAVPVVTRPLSGRMSEQLIDYLHLIRLSCFGSPSPISMTLSMCSAFHTSLHTFG